jgi:hypothetical protein
MRLSKSDFITAFIGISIFALLGFLLYTDLTSHSGAGNAELIGKILTKRNTAERKYSEEVVWDEVSRDSKLYNYDTVRTADQSEAVIKLKDGTEITLNENSMILLSITEKAVDIKFIQGTINAKAKNLTIQSGGSKISLNNSDVSLSQEKENLQMTVNRGKATLKTGKEEKVINENQNIQADNESIRLYNLTIKLIAPDNNRYIASAAEKTKVDFSWERPNGDYSVFLEIAANPSVSDPPIKIRSLGNAAAAALNEGIYYWRVTAVNNATKKIESSEIRKVAVVNNKPVVLITPANKSVIKFRDVNPMINFLWSKNESIYQYNLVIAGAPDMSSPLIKNVVEGNRISLNTLGQGTYYWRVANITETDQITNHAESPVNTFTVSKTEKIEPPLPISPAENRSVHPLAIVQKGLNFTWSNDMTIPETEIIIAEDRNFTKIVYKKNTRDTYIRMSDKLDEGIYYWSLRGIMGDGSTTDSSAVRRFRVVQSGVITLLEPKDRSVMITKDTRKGSDISFSWSKTELDGSYLLQLANDRNFTAIIKEMPVNDLSAVLPSIPEGTHYWRVKLFDENKSEILSSGVYSFDLLSLLGLPALISPTAGSTIDMLKRDTLDFYWKPVQGANLYRVGLYQIKDGIQQSIAEIETSQTSYKFTDLKKLDVGKFLWTLQAVEIDPGTNRMRRKSEEIKTTFSISLGIKGNFKLDTPNIINSE